MGDMFGYTKPRARRRVMMPARDAGNFPDGNTCAEFECRKCGHRTGWIYATKAETLRGIPCPHCN